MDILKYLSLHEQSDEQDRVGAHGRLDVTRLLSPGAPSHIIRGSLYDLQNAAKLAGNSYKVRPTVPGEAIFLDGVQYLYAKAVSPNVDLRIADYLNPAIVWADGSVLKKDGSYTWADETTGHAGPQNADLSVGLSDAGSFIWNLNLFPVFSGFSEPAPFTFPPRDTVVICTLDLLDKASAVLKSFIWISTTHNDGFNDITSTQITEPDQKLIPTFNAIKLTLNTSASINLDYALIEVYLYYFLQRLVLI